MPPLFHYCSSDSLLAILKSKTIWLSSLTLSNDSMEGRLVNSAILRLAEKDRLDTSNQERLRESLAFMERSFEGLGFCLSTEGDLLSQWRGYADDARGVSIGFSHAFLESLAKPPNALLPNRFSIEQVKYLEAEHEALVEPTYRELRKLIAAGAFRSGFNTLLTQKSAEEVAIEDRHVKETHRAFVTQMLELLPFLYSLKSHAFREEKEWRLVAITTASDFTDCQFRVSRSRLIPFRPVAFDVGAERCIEEIALGPRNETPLGVLRAMLKQLGFGEVSVRTSEATYR